MKNAPISGTQANKPSQRAYSIIVGILDMISGIICFFGIISSFITLGQDIIKGVGAFMVIMLVFYSGILAINRKEWKLVLFGTACSLIYAISVTLIDMHNITHYLETNDYGLLPQIIPAVLGIPAVILLLVSKRSYFQEVAKPSNSKTVGTLNTISGVLYLIGTLVCLLMLPVMSMDPSPVPIGFPILVILLAVFGIIGVRAGFLAKKNRAKVLVLFSSIFTIPTGLGIISLVFLLRQWREKENAPARP